MPVASQKSGVAPDRLRHLTDEYHRDLMLMLREAQELIGGTIDFVDRAWFTDRVLYCQGTLQEWLIDPLREAWDAAHPEADPADNPYPNVGYGGLSRKRPPRGR